MISQKKEMEEGDEHTRNFNTLPRNYSDSSEDPLNSDRQLTSTNGDLKAGLEECKIQTTDKKSEIPLDVDPSNPNPMAL